MGPEAIHFGGSVILKGFGEGEQIKCVANPPILNKKILVTIFCFARGRTIFIFERKLFFFLVGDTLMSFYDARVKPRL